jgi:CBS domain-containing protein
MRVADAMVVRPVVHGSSTTIGQLRAFFADEHVHMALLVDDGKLLGTVERADLARASSDDAPAREVASVSGRTIGPDVPLQEALAAMRRTGRRRFAVTRDTALLGLLCLKASGNGFCADEDVDGRRIQPL